MLMFLPSETTQADRMANCTRFVRYCDVIPPAQGEIELHYYIITQPARNKNIVL